MHLKLYNFITTLCLIICVVQHWSLHQTSALRNTHYIKKMTTVNFTAYCICSGYPLEACHPHPMLRIAFGWGLSLT